MLNTQSVYAQVDENGRIVLPQRLREQFGLGEEALFAGMGEHFQVWAPADYASDMEALDDWRDGLARGRRSASRRSTRSAARAGHDAGALRPPRTGAARPAPAGGGAGRGRLARRHASAPAAMRAALLDAGAARVIGIDRDPEALAAGGGLGRATSAAG